jgi:hypothetical protein
MGEPVVFNGEASFRLPPPEHYIQINSDGGRLLLVLRFTDGKLVAEYNPDDLDEACRIFLREIQRLWCLPGNGGVV